MSGRGTEFRETLLGTFRLDGEGRTRAARLDLRASADTVLRPAGTTEARVTGRIRIAGWADDPCLVGELEIAPLARRRIRYRLAFTADGRRLTLDGWKSVTPLRPVHSMTVLPCTLYEEGKRVGVGALRFPWARAWPRSWRASASRAARTPTPWSPRAGRASPAVPRSGTPPRPTR